MICSMKALLNFSCIALVLGLIVIATFLIWPRLIDHKSINPFIKQLSGNGGLDWEVFPSSHEPSSRVAYQRAEDDPELPNYLFLGDSISGNYGAALRNGLDGRFNIHRPPTNCGSSKKGSSQIRSWLGNFDQTGGRWDVISFNFGHWDDRSDKREYQQNLEEIIAQLEKTEAKLIWVSTCPVPGGYKSAGELEPREGISRSAPGRRHGVMKEYLNPWALEVVKRHPEISICDQWSLVASEKFYKNWYAKAGSPGGFGNDYGDVHLGGLLGEPIGRQLARIVLDSTGGKDMEMNPVVMDAEGLNSENLQSSLQNLDYKDFLDLISSKERLRRYNHLSQ